MKKNIFTIIISLFLGISTLIAQETDTFTDNRDGNTYKTVKIGERWWFAENLRFKTDNSWAYDNNESNVAKFGRLYTFEAAQKACPAGWHLAKETEWTSLSTLDNEKITGGKLKATSEWEAPNTGADNSMSFNALPGGYRTPEGEFTDKGKIAAFWSDTDNANGNTAWRIYLLYNNSGIMRGMDLKTHGFSVRCVKD
ncbi:MAG: fibrobacter succinogenes major paralogous domain-containing protein [Bacteroidales bacterium]|nr:fibrobacter succinogenes major paralogous domain-containing protein [Bacteroidales bacterium]